MIRTITVDGAVRARLLAVTFDLLAAALVAGAGDSTSLLDGLRRCRIGIARLVVVFSVRLDALRRRSSIVDGPVAGGLRPDGDGLVVGHFYVCF